jgi:hypothetical protein
MEQFEMRHKENEIQEKEEIETILDNAPVGRIGTSYQNRPYIVPINFVYHQGNVYFHSSNEGQMHAYMEANNQVCFEVDELGEIIPSQDPCEFSFKYRSIVAFGKVRFLHDPMEKKAILARLVQKYDARKIARGPIPLEKLNDVVVGEISIEAITGKKNPPS